MKRQRRLIYLAEPITTKKVKQKEKQEGRKKQKKGKIKSKRKKMLQGK